MGSNPGNSKSVNSVCTNKKIANLSSLLQYNYLTKNHLVYFRKCLLQKYNSMSTTPSPIHYPSYAHTQCCNIEKRHTQAKTTCLCWSISTY